MEQEGRVAAALWFCILYSLTALSDKERLSLTEKTKTGHAAKFG